MPVRGDYHEWLRNDVAGKEGSGGGGIHAEVPGEMMRVVVGRWRGSWACAPDDGVGA